MSRRFILLLGLLLGHGLGLLTPLTAMSVRPPTFNYLVSSSDDIVRASVADVESRWVTNDAGHRLIKTFVTIRVLERTADNTPDRLTLVFLGGTVGSESMRVGGMPTFRKGEKAWFFVRDNGKALCPLNFATHGAYPIVRDATTQTDRVTRINGVPLSSSDAVSQPLHDHPESHSSALAEGLTSSAFGEIIRRELVLIADQKRQLP